MSVCGLILAGGQGSRLGGADKAWLPFNGTPLVEHVLSGLRPQVDRVVVSANRGLHRYTALGVQTVSDQGSQSEGSESERSEALGPLAGLQAAQSLIGEDFVQLTPVDACALAPTLVADLMQNLLAYQADVAVPMALSNAADGHTELREQWLHALVRRDVLREVTPFLNRGGRKVQRFFAESGARITLVHFTQPQAAQWFHNINTHADLDRAL
jgi:molybdenum cofactor guanylyltransferase